MSIFSQLDFEVCLRELQSCFYGRQAEQNGR